MKRCESGLAEIILLWWTSAIWGQDHVFSYPESPQVHHREWLQQLRFLGRLGSRQSVCLISFPQGSPAPGGCNVYWYVQEILSPHYLTSSNLSIFICKMEPQWFWLTWVAVRVNICSWVNVCSAGFRLGPRADIPSMSALFILKSKNPIQKILPFKNTFYSSTFLTLEGT